MVFLLKQGPGDSLTLILQGCFTGTGAIVTPANINIDKAQQSMDHVNNFGDML